jgi:hypothetical protein
VKHVVVLGSQWYGLHAIVIAAPHVPLPSQCLVPFTLFPPAHAPAAHTAVAG